MKITARHLLELNLVDEVVPEPLGGAHNDLIATSQNLKRCLLAHLEQLLAMAPSDRLQRRYERFRAHGHFAEKQPLAA